MSDLRSVLLLCWRDTGHPQGGGSETYLQRIGAQLAASGVAVTLRTARYPGAPRREVVDGVQISRAGGRYSVYVWALLAMAAARVGLGSVAACGPTSSVDTQNGLPFWPGWCTAAGWWCWCTTAIVSSGRWPGRARPAGLVLESRLSPRLHRRNQYVTVSLPSARDLVALGVDNERIAVVRNGLDEAPAIVVRPALGHAAGGGAVPAGPHKQIEDALETVAQLRPGSLGCTWISSAMAGGGSDCRSRGWLGISDAVTFHGHVDDLTKHHVLQRSWVHVLPSRKEGWGLAVVEAAQHGCPPSATGPPADCPTRSSTG